MSNKHQTLLNKEGALKIGSTITFIGLGMFAGVPSLVAEMESHSSSASSSAIGLAKAAEGVPFDSRLAELVDPEFLSRAESVRLEELPEGMVKWLAASGEENLSVEHRRLLVYELEFDGGHGFETELFVDAMGETVLTVIKPDGDDVEIATEFEKLPPQVQDSLIELLGDTPLIRLQGEIEWGIPVFAAKWQGLRGPQEVKLTHEGRVLFFELPSDEPVPDPVKELASGGVVEAMLLDVYVSTIPSSSGDVRIVGAVTAAGWPLRLSVASEVSLETQTE